MWIDALTQKVREGGRITNTAMLVATGVNAEGYREILGLDVGSADDGATWTAFLRGLVAGGLSGVKLVVSDCHLGLKQAIAAVLDGAAWQLGGKSNHDDPPMLAVWAELRLAV